MLKRIKHDLKIGTLLLLVVALTLVGPLTVPAPAQAAGAVTLDTPATGTTFGPEIVRISGTYTNAYDLRLFIDGSRQVLATMVDPDGNDSGTWYYDLDTSTFYGEVQITARGLDKDTRYGVWSQPITLYIDNPAAAPPVVSIVSPREGVSLSGIVTVQVDVEAHADVERVEVRINSGPWQQATADGSFYTLEWDTAPLGDKTSSIEARATLVGGQQASSLTTYAKVGAGTNEPFYMGNQDRAIWIWEPEAYKLLLNPGSRDVLDAFAQDTETFGSDPITTFYLAIGPFAGIDILEDDPGKVRDFIAWAHERGYQVHACIAGGTSPPYMGAYERYHPMAIREIERVINYNIAAGDNEKFDGINVDIEPYIAPDFANAYPSLQLQYLDGLSKMIERRDTAGINLPFGPAIPRWYDTSDNAKDITWNGSTKWLSEHIQDISDYISIMNYRDTADGSAGIIAQAQGEINYADSIGKPGSVVIGVETLDVANSGDPSVITFREEGRTHMEAELDKVNTAFAHNPSYGGIAMHHYDSLLNLPSDWGKDRIYWQPPADTEPPTAVSSELVAAADGYQAATLSYGMAYDNTEIDRYIFYRSTIDGFTPDASHIVGMTRGLSYRDVGLLPGTTYYYRVAARDVQGNIGPASQQAAVTTATTELKPAILDGLHVDYAANNQAVAVVQAIDLVTGEPLAGIRVEGRFTYAGGKYVVTTTDEKGWATFVSETIPEGWQAGFEPRALTAAGYYWAQAYDRPHTTAWAPWSGLQSLELFGADGVIELPFETGQTRYTVAVPEHIDLVTVRPEAAAASSIVLVNGQRVEGGQATAPIALQPGANMLRVLVYNLEGTIDTYTLTVTRGDAGSEPEPVDNVFVAAEDTYVSEHEPRENFGSEPLLEVLSIPRANGGGNRTAFLKFRFEDYNEPVEDAAFYFYVAEKPAVPVPVKIEAYDADNWSESEMNWDNRPRSGVPGWYALGKITVRDAGWHRFDVTQFVANQAATDRIATIRLLDEDLKATPVRIHSRENETNQPYLLINPSSDAALRTLTLDPGSVEVVPNDDESVYEAAVPYIVESVMVTAVPSERHATATVNGVPVERGQPSEPVALKVGDNIITVQVRAQDGTIRDYSLVVKRDLPAVAELSSLTLTGMELNTDFRPDLTYYEGSVTYSVYGIGLQAVSADPLAGITIGEQGFVGVASVPFVPLQVGDNELRIKVTAQNGSERTYVLAIERQPQTVDPGPEQPPEGPEQPPEGPEQPPGEPEQPPGEPEQPPGEPEQPPGEPEQPPGEPQLSSDATVHTLSIEGAVVIPDPGGDGKVYKTVVPHLVSSVTVTAVPTNPHATVTVNGIPVERGQPSEPIALQVGDNTIVVRVTAQDGTVRDYTLVVKRDLPAVTELSSLTLTGAALSPNFHPDVTRYELRVPNRVRELGLSAATLDPLAVLRVGERDYVGTAAISSVPLRVGVNELRVKVTAQNGSERTYTIVVERRAANPGTGPGWFGDGQLIGGGDRRAIVDVGGQSSSVFEVELVRSMSEGRVKDAVILEESAIDRALRSAGDTDDLSFRLEIRDSSTEPADELHVTVRSAAAALLAERDAELVIASSYGTIRLSAEALRHYAAAAGGSDLVLVISPIQEDERSALTERFLANETLWREKGQDSESAANIVGVPVRIETKLEGRTVGVYLPLDEAPGETDLSRWAVYIEHSDGENVLLRPSKVSLDDSTGRLAGLEVEVDKFSTFAIVRLPQPLIDSDGEGGSLEAYVNGYEDGTFRPEDTLTRAELAVLFDRLSPAASGEPIRLPYADMTDSHWAAAAISRLTSEGIVEGRSSGLFAPGEPVTRAEFAAIAVRWHNEAGGAASAAQFGDTAGHWAEAYVAVSAGQGWIEGYEDGTFRPDREVTRAEAVTVLNRLTGREPLLDESISPSWDDVPVTHWAFAAIEAASRHLPAGESTN
ncbi:cadherin-like beta sandwich domain-containing protein [Paenibacillus senegalensis]|uniref:cadherin-like beta sandwich domain-containing protein n=1 Tax=Paenibacillus senegalensis TaxID=1465766 RepID=UPI0002898EA3|nr:cadherin-like beta sandwich domain-containing protein [Paenibacillus senegalensis]